MSTRLEAALRLTENGKAPKKRVGEVVVVTLAPKEVGADAARRARHGRRPRDPRRHHRRPSSTATSSAKALKALVDAEKPDLVLMGKQAVDGDTNQVGQRACRAPRLADGHLRGDDPRGGGSAAGRARGRRRRAHAARSTLPALDHGGPAHRRRRLSVYSQHTDAGPTSTTTACASRRCPAIMAAKKKPLDVKALADLVARSHARDELPEVRAPRAARSAGVKVKDVAELVDKLTNVSKVHLRQGARPSMAHALVVAELAEDGSVKKATLSAISFAKAALPALGGSFSILVLGANTTAAAAEPRGATAPRRSSCAEDAVAHELHRRALRADRRERREGLRARGRDRHEPVGKDLMPRVAARLDAAYAGDCAGVRVRGQRHFVYKRPMFAGNAFGTAKLTTPVQVGDGAPERVLRPPSRNRRPPIEARGQGAGRGRRERASSSWGSRP